MRGNRHCMAISSFPVSRAVGGPQTRAVRAQRRRRKDVPPDAAKVTGADPILAYLDAADSHGIDECAAPQFGAMISGFRGDEPDFAMALIQGPLGGCTATRIVIGDDRRMSGSLSAVQLTGGRHPRRGRVELDAAVVHGSVQDAVDAVLLEGPPYTSFLLGRP